MRPAKQKRQTRMNPATLEDDNRSSCLPRPVTPIGILAEKLQRVSESLDTGSVINSASINDLRQATALATRLDSYVAECTTPESAELATLAKSTAVENWEGQFDAGQTEISLEQEMLSGHVEGQFLKMLVAVTGAANVLEIGMFTGYSALAIAEGLARSGRVVACELDPYTAEFARREFDRSPHGNKIQVEVGPAAETLQKLAHDGNQFDFVFIDADKPGYIGYFRQLMTLELLCPGALICVDNTLLQGETYCEENPSANGRAVVEFNRCVAEDPRVEQVLIPLRDGITMIRIVDQQSKSGESK